jgi:hypothetical protein
MVKQTWPNANIDAAALMFSANSPLAPPATCVSRQDRMLLRAYPLLFCLLLAGLPAVSACAAQPSAVGVPVRQVQAGPPAWMNHDERERLYPAREWYTGLAHGSLKAGAGGADSRKDVENTAKITLAESIVATIEGDWKIKEFLRQLDLTSETERMGRITTKVTIPNLKTQLYEVPSKNEIYAFAAVKCADLAVFLSAQIDKNLNDAETVMAIAKQQRVAGEKKRAREKIEEVKQMLVDINSYSALLVPVNAAMNAGYDRGLQTRRVNKLRSEADQLLMGLDITVYMDCRHEIKNSIDDAFRTDPRIFCGKIKDELSENGCHITNNRNEADYVLSLVTSTTQRSDGKGQYGVLTYYANVEASLHNRITQKDVINFSLREFDAGNNPEHAATRAFNRPELKEGAMNRLLPAIKN